MVCRPEDYPQIAARYGVKLMPDPSPTDYTPRTRERLIEILNSQSTGPRSWQAEAAAELRLPDPSPEMIERAQEFRLAHHSLDSKATYHAATRDKLLAAFAQSENDRARKEAMEEERERILQLLPGGQTCDPQEVADSIRAAAPVKAR